MSNKLKDGGASLSRSEINSRDHAGLTLLLRAASSTHPSAKDFVEALLNHPAVDLHVQDPESGWNALHRSLYSGNVSIARMLLAKERIDLTSHTSSQSAVGKVGQLIKTKDHEGNSPFDVYNSTIAARSLKGTDTAKRFDDESDYEDRDDCEFANLTANIASGVVPTVSGHEFYMFGSNKNLSLGVGDENDRQYPERITLQRSDKLMSRFYEMYLADRGIELPSTPPALYDIPTLIRCPPLIIRDVAMSKLHTAVLTDDPVSNLYICGVGRGGRLGLGDENSQFKFVPVEGPFEDRKIHRVALGQNHSMAVTEDGELWTWGLNSDCQLGYALPPLMRLDEEPMSLAPRQVFGPLKKELVQGVAASSVHSVAHTASSLYCWGRNLGQLALMDADSRSLDVQPTPRKVAASLLSTPIEMVSAIDKATTCLLGNHTVWVFTNYGYNLVKFPYPDVFRNHNLSATSCSSRQHSKSRHCNIKSVASGGDTIAAVTARGDLFTMQLNNKLENHQAAGSTTNPVKIKSALTQPKRVWDSRKDGVACVSVGECGSVIICTQTGAVWKRVKRAKGKIASSSNPADSKKKDFKFERVPYITDCVAVRSSTFGAFGAIRKDSRVMSTDIGITAPSLWDDIGSLLCLNDFEASTLAPDGALGSGWNAAIAREQPGSVPHEILRSFDVEQDLLQWISENSPRFHELNMEVRTSLNPDLKLPVHGWLLAGRSRVLREALAEYRIKGCTDAHPDAISIERAGNRALVTFVGIDIYTLLNIIVYTYTDAIVPVWRYMREAPSLAHRFRQVRLELMKLGTRLEMPKLEAAARLQAGVEPSLDVNLRDAVADPAFFDDADVVIELDGDCILAHSQLICQRCPFFEGMFRGRSQGQWLACRRDPSLQPEPELVRAHLEHIAPETFHYVMEYLYTDAGVGIFDDVCTGSLDEFSELVLDVMGVANELMLDRLSEICQCLVGKFVTTRNVANLLNEISPCSVTKFRDVGLEYVCLQLETMLENSHLDGLEDDLLEELDQVVRNNQLARFPIVRSGRAELLLHERYPDLALDVEEERRRRAREMAFRHSQREEDKKTAGSYKTRFGSLDEIAASTPDKHRRKSKASRNEPFSPTIRPRDSHPDLIFNMDDDERPRTAASIPQETLATGSGGNESNLDSMPTRLPERLRAVGSSSHMTPGGQPSRGRDSPRSFQGPGGDQRVQAISQPSPTAPPARASNGPWASSAMPPLKLDLKNIMQEASSSTSALTAGLASQADKLAASNRPQAKMSQKLRKRQQMLLQAEAQAAAEKEKATAAPWETVDSAARPAPWRAATAAPAPAPAASAKASLKGAIQPCRGETALFAKPLVAAEANAQVSKRRTASPDTRFSGQGRANSLPVEPNGPSSSPSPSPSQPKGKRPPLVPHSRSYIKPEPKVQEAALGRSSMADIIGQQKLEQLRVKEAVAKRSLQEIQEEQAFQEWWDQESRRTQEEEAGRLARAKDKDQAAANRRGRKGRGRRPMARARSGSG